MVEHPRGNAEYISYLNKVNVLNVIRESGTISRADVVKKTGISAPTVTRIVESLIHDEGLVLEEGKGHSSGGRPPVMVRFDGDNNFVIGIDWGRTHITGTLADLHAASVMTIDEQTHAGGDFALDLEKATKIIKRLIEHTGIAEKKLRGIGIAAAGYYNVKRHLIEFSPNFNWKDVDIKGALAPRFHVPIVVDNVSRAMALGELWYGRGKEFKDFLFVNIGYGLGSGMVVGGKPFYGFEGLSGEIGHTLAPALEGQQVKCVCGKENCLECFASGRGLAQMATALLREYPDSLLNTWTGEGSIKLDARLLSEAAAAGDSLALKVFETSAHILGKALANFANVFNPGAIILGGKVSQAGDFYTEQIRRSFESALLVGISRVPQLLESALGGQAAVKGAIALILKEVLLLSDPSRSTESHLSALKLKETTF